MKRLARNAEDKDYLKSSRSSSLSEVIVDSEIPKSYRNKNQMATNQDKNDLDAKITKYYDSSSENEGHSLQMKKIIQKSNEKEKYRLKKEQGKEAFDQLTSDDEGDYYQETDTRNQDARSEEDLHATEVIQDYQIRAKMRKEALLREQQASVERQ